MSLISVEFRDPLLNRSVEIQPKAVGCGSSVVFRNSITGAASDVISGWFVTPIVPNKCVKFRDPCTNRSREIPPEAVGGGVFDSLSREVPTGGNL